MNLQKMIRKKIENSSFSNICLPVTSVINRLTISFLTHLVQHLGYERQSRIFIILDRPVYLDSLFVTYHGP